VEQHTIVGTEMLKAVEVGPQVRDAVLYHHENYDGTGYPAKLSGEQIPVLARVIRVADSFRALTSRRTYQRQYSIEEAIEVLKHRSGALFDPRIVSVFVDVVRKRRDMFGNERAPGRAKGAERVETSGKTANPQGGI
jgi:HD-GYP domain-containing protein (c-di-GMP phosphodiesterase class II)